MSASQQCFPCSNPKCGQPMSNDYLCIGCRKPVHWFCAAGSEEVNMSKGHGMHYWCPPCHSKHLTDTMDDLDVSRLATCARNDDDVAELSEVIPLLFQRRNDGNDEQNDQAEEEFDHSGNDARTGDAEDQCNKTDDHNNQPASEQDEVDPSLLKFPPIAGNNSTNYHNNQPTSEQDEVDLALLKLPPIAGNKSTTSKRSAESTVGGTRKRHKSTSALAAPKRRAAKATSSTATTTAASTPKRHAAKAKSSSAATNAASTPKRRAAKATSFTAASTAASTTDELIGKLVGFYLDSPMGQSLKVSFGKKWSDQAVCFLLNEEHGHLVGTVMRAVGQSSKKKKSVLEEQYEIAWEFTALGQSTVDARHVIGAVLVGAQLESKRQPSERNHSNSRRRQGRPKARGRKQLLHRAVSMLNANYSDDDLAGSAPASDEDGINDTELDEASSGSDAENGEDIVDWITFADMEGRNYDEPILDIDNNEALNKTQQSTESIEPRIGLHWDTSAKISSSPDIKKPTEGCSVKQQYSYLFKTPIDSFFALIPYIFWEIVCEEVNRYASEYLSRKNTRQICGYIWKAVTINEILTYFGILMFSMLYPQTGRRVRTAWKNQQVNSWTAYMTLGRFSQINSMLHFNNNSDQEGLAKDSLHKIRPLLQILKKTLGRYAVLGTEYSFDEATMACFSRYARGLLCFNPQKPTGKFHFKIYMLCCAITNLVIKLRIHTKDSSDMEFTHDEADSEEVNKTDRLTSEMCSVLEGTGAVVNMDNYYMSTTAAIHLREKGVLCRGTIRANRKFVPKSVLFTSRECRESDRGTTRMAVNVENSLVAVGWLDNKAVNFISTADTTEMVSVERRIKNEKVEVPAPSVVKNYNMYMGGVDKHDKLRSTFALGKHHKFKKYYVKLMLFLVDIAMTNSWIYYRMTNPSKCKKSESRANFFLAIAEHLVRPGYDWAAKYKVMPDSIEDDLVSKNLPQGRRNAVHQADIIQDMERAVTENKCEFVDFTSVPFQLEKEKQDVSGGYL